MHSSMATLVQGLPENAGKGPQSPGVATLPGSPGPSAVQPHLTEAGHLDSCDGRRTSGKPCDFGRP